MIYMSFREEQREYANYKKNASKNQYRCKNCCRTIYIPRDKEKSLCPSCGQMIEKNEKKLKQIYDFRDFDNYCINYLNVIDELKDSD